MKTALTALAIAFGTAASAVAQTPIEVAPGHGTNINFVGTGETIQRIWLDDPERFVLSTDGCLSGLDAEDCETEGAQILHVRLIERIDIPGLPPARTSTGALLTIVTEGGNIYTYTLHPSHTSEAVVEAIPPKTPVSTVSPDDGAVQRGRTLLLARGEIERGSEEWEAIERFLELRSRFPDPEAARRAGLSIERIHQLENLGDL